MQHHTLHVVDRPLRRAARHSADEDIIRVVQVVRPWGREVLNVDTHVWIVVVVAHTPVLPRPLADEDWVSRRRRRRAEDDHYSELCVAGEGHLRRSHELTFVELDGRPILDPSLAVHNAPRALPEKIVVRVAICGRPSRHSIAIGESSHIVCVVLHQRSRLEPRHSRRARWWVGWRRWRWRR